MENKEKEIVGKEELERFVDFYENDVKNMVTKKFDFKSKSVMVSSGFGNGKTTLKNNFNEYLNEKNNKKKIEQKTWIFDINIWLNQYKRPAHIFFMEMVSENLYLKTEISKKLKIEISDYLKKKIPGLEKIINILFENSTKNTYEEIKDLYQFENVFKVFLDFIEKKNIKIIFLFDELERCSKQFINLFFSDFQLILNNENITIFTFTKKEYLNELFNQSAFSEPYISKFFNLDYWLTPSVKEYFHYIFKKTISFENTYSAFEDTYPSFPFSTTSENNYSLIEEENILTKEYISFREIVRAEKSTILISKYFSEKLKYWNPRITKYFTFLIFLNIKSKGMLYDCDWIAETLLEHFSEETIDNLEPFDNSQEFDETLKKINGNKVSNEFFVWKLIEEFNKFLTSWRERK